MFQRRHHIKIAETIKTAFKMDGWLSEIQVTEAFVKVLKEDNELFEEDKFRQYISGEE